MTKKKLMQSMFLIAGILLILAIACIYMAFNKMFNYKNNETYQYKSVNAYVGGDAYNYIINANYFSGYASLGGCLIISSAIYTITGIKQMEIKEKSNHSK